MAEAKERGNVRGATDLPTRLAIVWLAADDPPKAHQEIDRALEPWEGFHHFHYTAFISRNEADLYAGDAAAAYRRLIETWPAVEGSLLPHSQILRLEALFVKGRTELAAASSGDRETRLREAKKSTERIEREKMDWTRPMVDLLQAGAAHLRGDRDTARQLLRRAVDASERSEMHLLGTAARRRLGELTGGEEGGDLVATADAWMAAREIARPERMTAMLAPGFE